MTIFLIIRVPADWPEFLLIRNNFIAGTLMADLVEATLQANEVLFQNFVGGCDLNRLLISFETADQAKALEVLRAQFAKGEIGILLWPFVSIGARDDESQFTDLYTGKLTKPASYLYTEGFITESLQQATEALKKHAAEIERRNGNG